MQINPLDTIREETTLLELFQNIMSESAYVDTIVKEIFEQQNEIKDKYLILGDFDNLRKELNEKIKSRNLKCSIVNVPSKELLNIEPMQEFLKQIFYKEPMAEYLKFDTAFICQKHNKIFDSEEELKDHLRQIKHFTIMKRISKTEKRLIIIKNNTTCISVPLFELFEKSGALTEINNKIKPINLKCHIFKGAGEKYNILNFEPAFMCRQCSNIFGTEEELKEHEKKHEIERKRYSSEISKPYEESQRKYEEYRKWRDSR